MRPDADENNILANDQLACNAFVGFVTEAALAKISPKRYQTFLCGPIFVVVAVTSSGRVYE